MNIVARCLVVVVAFVAVAAVLATTFTLLGVGYWHEGWPKWVTFGVGILTVMIAWNATAPKDQ